MNIALIGAGRVARYLGHRLKEDGHAISIVYSRTLQHAKNLATALQTEFTDDLSALPSETDVFLVSISDDATPDIASKLRLNKQLLVHTAGSLPIEVLAHSGTPNFGILYPLFSFSGNEVKENRTIPLLIEASNTETLQGIQRLAMSITDRVLESSHNQRLLLHLAAVFANNFSNHLFSISDDLLKKNELSLDLLLPMLANTVESLKTHTPKDMQTGPAQRGDSSTMQKHLEMLSNRPDLQNVYKALSESILRTKNQHE